MQLVVVAFKIQNLGVIGLLEATIGNDDELIFGVVASNEATLHGLLKNEFGMFHHLLVKLENYLLPFTWWKANEI
jgi:hypothetical protein